MGEALCSDQTAKPRLYGVQVCRECDRVNGGGGRLSGGYRAAEVGWRVKAIVGRDAVGRSGEIFPLRVSRREVIGGKARTRSFYCTGDRAVSRAMGGQSGGGVKGEPKRAAEPGEERPGRT